MAKRRSLADFVVGLKKQIEQEQGGLEQLQAAKRDKIAAMDVDIEAQRAKVDALQGVLKQMSEPDTGA